MSKELIGSHSVHETLVRQTQIDAARIEELERERDEWKARAEFSYKQRDELEREIERKMSAAAFVLKERDALQADNARLREALEHSVLYVPELATVPGIAAALAATPEQSLARIRNQVREECAVVGDDYATYSGAHVARVLRATKEMQQ